MISKPFVLTVGSAVCDTFIESKSLHSGILKPDNQPFLLIEEGTKIEVSRLRRIAGGGALNAARCLKQLEFNTAAFFKIAADEAGLSILKELQSEEIDTDLAITTASTHTATSFILMAESGNHPILAYRGANETITQKELTILDSITGSEGVYLAPLSGYIATHASTFVEKFFNKKIPVFHNPNIHQLTAENNEVIKTLPFLTAFMLNYKEAEFFYKKLQNTKSLKKEPFSIENYCTKILEKGAQIAIVTNGAEGLYAATKQAFYFCPSIKTTVLNTVGAGDVCGATIFGSLLKGYSLETALHYGSINSAKLLSSSSLPPRLLTFAQLKQEAKRLQIMVQKTA